MHLTILSILTNSNLHKEWGLPQGMEGKRFQESFLFQGALSLLVFLEQKKERKGGLSFGGSLFSFKVCPWRFKERALIVWWVEIQFGELVLHFPLEKYSSKKEGILDDATAIAIASHLGFIKKVRLIPYLFTSFDQPHCRLARKVTCTSPRAHYIL